MRRFAPHQQKGQPSRRNGGSGGPPVLAYDEDPDLALRYGHNIHQKKKKKKKIPVLNSSLLIDKTNSYMS
jgi:hypothetical protein